MSLPPGPPLPAIVQTLLFILAPIAYEKAIARRWGDLYTSNNMAFGKEVVIADPELVKQIFTGDPNVLHAGEANSGLGTLLGKRSVFVLDGPQHLRHRRMLMPPFHGDRLQAYAGTMRAITEQVVDQWQPGAAFPLHSAFQRITLDVILRTVFGLDLGPRHAELLDRLTRLFACIQSPLGMLLMAPEFQKDLGPWWPWGEFQRQLRAADALIYAQIRERRVERENTPTASRNDVLSLLLEATDDQGAGLTDAELRDELMTLLTAGHETSATSLSWAFERILNHPEVEAKLRAELDAVAPNRAITAEDLPKLEYLDATIKEVMRVRPVVLGVGRRLKAPITLRGYEIPAGTGIQPSIYAVHRRPDLYPEPERFLPERFVGKKPDPYGYFPFGGGVRRCIGMAYALYEMKIVLATVLRRVKLRLEKPRPLGFVLRAFLISPAGGTRVVLVERLPERAAVAAPS